MPGDGIVDILNVKCHSGMIFSLLSREGFFSASYEQAALDFYRAFRQRA